jgi:predicted DNA binding CopG/RHH family protein
MQRIIKRFLLRSQIEKEKGDEGDAEQIKQDLQMFRFEMHIDLKRTRMNYLKSLAVIHGGISVMGDEALKSSKTETIEKFSSFKSYQTNIDLLLHDSNIDIDND